MSGDAAVLRLANAFCVASITACSKGEDGRGDGCCVRACIYVTAHDQNIAFHGKHAVTVFTCSEASFAYSNSFGLHLPRVSFHSTCKLTHDAADMQFVPS